MSDSLSFDNTRPMRLYVIIGRPLTYRRPPGEYVEPSYATDPRHYGLMLFDRQISDEEFNRNHRWKVKAFIDEDDAFTFGCRLNLEGLQCPVYDRVGDEWIYNAEETSRIADEFG